MSGMPTGTVTFLFTDIEGSTRLARDHPEAWEIVRERHHEILREAIQSQNGFVFQIIGDAFCAAFHTAGDATIASIKAQQQLQGEDWGEAPIRVRMGIHTGEANTDGTEYRGYLSLSLVQRIMSAGHGGQILVSDATEKLLREKLPGDVSLLDLGEHKFKDVPHLLRVFQVCVPGLQSEFPYLRTLEAHPNNLPAQVTSFVGREKELADVKRLLQNAHMLTLIGPGGTGKTRLSLQAANEMLVLYPDGVWFVELAPILDPLFVPRTTAMAVGLRDEPQRPVLDMLCDFLHEKRMLILLDNCEHLVEACAQMVDRVLHSAPNVRVLASSREALGIGGEVTYRVPSLGLPDMSHLPPSESLDQYEAVRLFIDRASFANPSFTVTNENAPALAQICHRLDGIPLAIELAAVKIRVLSLEQIAQRLDDRFRLLTGGSRTALERHQTLRAAIDWSYNYLPAAEQVLFRRLSVFVNGWTLEAAEYVCQGLTVESGDVLDLLEQLIHKSLVSMDEKYGNSRYRILETIRQYANKKLVEAGESDISRDRHMEYFLTLAETAEPHLLRPEQLEWLAQLDADYENIRSALEWALNKESAEPSLRMCSALGWYWSTRSHWLEGTKWLTSSLAKPRQNSKSENMIRVKVLYQDAALANDLDDLDRMKDSARQSLNLAEDVSGRRDIAIARFHLGWVLDRQFDHEYAISLMEQSLKEFQEIQDLYWEAVNCRWLGRLLFLCGRLSLREKVDRQLGLARRAGERDNLAHALLEYAWQLYSISFVEQAEKYAEEAKTLLNQIGSDTSEVDRFFGCMEWLKGNCKEARTTFIKLQEHCQLLGDRNIQSIAIESLGSLALEEGDLEQAHSYLEKSLEMARELGDQDSIAWRQADLGNIFLREGKIGDFKQSYRESILLARKLEKNGKAEVLLVAIDSTYAQKPANAMLILGAVQGAETGDQKLITPIGKRYCDRAEVYARAALGDDAIETALVDGQKLSLDEALDLALKTVEELN